MFDNRVAPLLIIATVIAIFSLFAYKVASIKKIKPEYTASSRENSDTINSQQSYETREDLVVADFINTSPENIREFLEKNYDSSRVDFWTNTNGIEKDLRNNESYSKIFAIPIFVDSQSPVIKSQCLIIGGKKHNGTIVTAEPICAENIFYSYAGFVFPRRGDSRVEKYFFNELDDHLIASYSNDSACDGDKILERASVAFEEYELKFYPEKKVLNKSYPEQIVVDTVGGVIGHACIGEIVPKLGVPESRRLIEYLQNDKK